LTGKIVYNYTNYLSNQPYLSIPKSTAFKVTNINTNDQYSQLLKNGKNHQSRKEYLSAINQYTLAIKLNPTATEAYYNRGLVYLIDKRFSRSIQDIDKVLTLSPGYKRAHFYKALALYKSRKYIESIVDFDIHINKYNNDSNGYYFRGNAHHKLDHLKEARADYKKTLQYDPDHIRANHMLSRLEPSKSLKYNNGTKKSKPVNSSLELSRSELLQLAQQQSHNNKIDDSIKTLSRLIKLSKSDHTAFYFRALAFQKKGLHTKALDDINKSIEINSSVNYSYYLIRGELLLHMNQNLNMALSDMQQYINERTNNPKAYNSRGKIYLILGDTKKAIADFKKALKITPNYEEADSNLALAEVKTGKTNLNVKPNQPSRRKKGLTKKEMFYTEGIALYKAKQYAQAIISFTTELKTNPYHWGSFLYKAMSHYNLKQFTDAIRDFDEIIDNNIDFENIDICYYYKGLCYFNKKQFKQSITILSQAISSSEHNLVKSDFLLSKRSQAYFYIQQYKKGLEDINQAINYEERADYYVFRARIYDKLKRFNDAIEDYDSAITLAPNLVDNLAQETKSLRDKIQSRTNHFEVGMQTINNAMKELATGKHHITLCRNAIESFGKHIQQNGPDAKSLLFRAKAYWFSDDKVNAKNNYKLAEEIDIDLVYGYFTDPKEESWMASLINTS
tara:strand:- start:270 stop:2297 length:2028 start_codon:yes stop_codon:yes gene_type:complete